MIFGADQGVRAPAAGGVDLGNKSDVDDRSDDISVRQPQPELLAAEHVGATARSAAVSLLLVVEDVIDRHPGPHFAELVDAALLFALAGTIAGWQLAEPVWVAPTDAESAAKNAAVGLLEAADDVTERDPEMADAALVFALAATIAGWPIDQPLSERRTTHRRRVA